MYCVISSFFSNFKFRNLLILLLIFVFLLNKSAISDEEKLKNIILLQNGLINISKLENTDYVKSSSDLIKNTYNTKKMIRMIIGEKWNRFSEDQQEKIHLVFRKYIALNYIKRFKKIKKPTFQINGKRKIGEKYFYVQTSLLINDHEKIEINYLLNQTEEKEWKIFDVLLAGSISEIATKKSEFSQIIKEKGIDFLIDSLKKKNSELKNH